MISIRALVLVISICFLVPQAAAQSVKYPKMAPVDQYLQESHARGPLHRLLGSFLSFPSHRLH